MRAALIASLLSSPAAAQGVFDMGALTNTLSVEATRQSEAARASPAPAPAAFRFQATPEQRKRNLQQFVEKTRAVDPAGAGQLEALFAGNDVIALIGRGIAPYGLRVDDLADAYTVYWVSAWMASRGQAGENDKGQVAAVRRQSAAAMAAVPALKTATDAQRQEFAEALLVQAMLLDASVGQAQADPAKLEQVKAAARQGARASGLDLDAFELTPAGFVKAAPKR